MKSNELNAIRNLQFAVRNAELERSANGLSLMHELMDYLILHS